MRAPLESRARSISRTCAEKKAVRKGKAPQNLCSAHPQPWHLAEHGAQLLTGPIVATIGQQLLHLLLDLLLIQMPAVGIFCACTRCGIRGTCE